MLCLFISLSIQFVPLDKTRRMERTCKLYMERLQVQNQHCCINAFKYYKYMKNTSWDCHPCVICSNTFYLFLNALQNKLELWWKISLWVQSQQITAQLVEQSKTVFRLKLILTSFLKFANSSF